ncbi:MAG TPA: hypothetical protein VJ992_14425 [Gemmatimonadales bacterium]|nr:hypothetical protein [Gemmatimonadales bacterium]
MTGHRLVRAAAGAAAIALASACAGVGGVRPTFAPLSNAVVDTVNGNPTPVIIAVSAQVTANGLQIAWSSPREGYLETGWYDTDSRQPVSGPGPQNNTSVVRLRFWADSLLGNRTQLTAEAVYERILDPSRPERDLEEMVPPGHPGRVLLDGIIRGVQDRSGR